MTEHQSTSTGTEGPVDKAFHLLQVLVAAGAPVGVRELGRRTGLPRSTASRLVANLERLRMIDRTADGLIVPGSGLATLQPGAVSDSLLRDRFQPLLAELVATFDESAALSIDDGDAVLYLGHVACSNPVSVHDVSGARHGFHLVAPGLVAMAGWDRDRLSAWLAEPLESATVHSVTKPSEVRRRLRTVAAAGHAWTDQELDLGVNGLAVPIPVAGPRTVAVSLYGPSYRFSPAARPDLAEQFQDLVRARVPDPSGDV